MTLEYPWLDTSPAWLDGSRLMASLRFWGERCTSGWRSCLTVYFLEPVNWGQLKVTRIWLMCSPKDEQTLPRQSE